MWAKKRRQAIVCPEGAFIERNEVVANRVIEAGGEVLSLESGAIVVLPFSEPFSPGPDALTVDRLRVEAVSTVLRSFLKKSYQTVRLAIPSDEFWILVYQKKSDNRSSNRSRMTNFRLSSPRGDILLRFTKGGGIESKGIVCTWFHDHGIEVRQEVSDGLVLDASPVGIPATVWIEFYLFCRAHFRNSKAIELEFVDCS